MSWGPLVHDTAIDRHTNSKIDKLNARFGKPEDEVCGIKKDVGEA